MKKYLLYIVIFLIGAVAGMWLCRSYHFRDDVKMVQRDTVVRYDTIRIESPMETKYITTTDTLLVQLTDTISIHDTVYLVLNKQIKEYRGKEYFAKVSGYEPSLDYIEVYPRTETIYQTETIVPKERKHSVSLYGSVGYMNAVRIPVGLEYQYHIWRWLAVCAKVEHDFALNTTGVYGGAEITIGW